MAKPSRPKRTADHPIGDEAEEAFDLIQPRTARRGEMKVEVVPFLGFQPPLDNRAFVSEIGWIS